jgi:hypothetical protein
MISAMRVREGSSGLLYLTNVKGENELFIPNYDMDAAISLLQEFQQLRQTNGVPITASYQFEGFNWYPSMVSFLFWYVFFPFVKYQPLITDYAVGRKRFLWENHGTFRSFLDLMGRARAPSLKSRLHYYLVKWSNRCVVRRNRVPLLYFSFGRNDFRGKEIRKILQQLGCKFIEVVPRTSFLNILRNLFRGGKDYYYGREAMGNRFHYTYDITSLSSEKQKLFALAIRAVERSITSYLVEYNHHRKALASCSAHTFYGLDDINGYIFPLLYACRKRGIRTIGHQHGAYVRRHVGYMMPGIENKEFIWFDRLIVWGEYWKEKLLKVSKVYRPDFFIVGANKFRQTYPTFPEPAGRARNVLIPYEFLTNTHKVGRYMEKLIERGYEIFFKPRPDEELAEQLAAYCVSEDVRERITVVTKLDEATLSRIDIIAGTMTTLIYELLPCNKIIGILETEYKHLDDLVEEGLAHKVRLEDLDKLDERFFSPTCVSTDNLFGTSSLTDILRKHVVSPPSNELAHAR